MFLSIVVVEQTLKSAQVLKLIMTYLKKKKYLSEENFPIGPPCLAKAVEIIKEVIVLLISGCKWERNILEKGKSAISLNHNSKIARLLFDVERP